MGRDDPISDPAEVRSIEAEGRKSPNVPKDGMGRQRRRRRRAGNKPGPAKGRRIEAEDRKSPHAPGCGVGRRGGVHPKSGPVKGRRIEAEGPNSPHAAGGIVKVAKRRQRRHGARTPPQAARRLQVASAEILAASTATQARALGSETSLSKLNKSAVARSS